MVQIRLTAARPLRGPGVLAVASSPVLARHLPASETAPKASDSGPRTVATEGYSKFAEQRGSQAMLTVRRVVPAALWAETGGPRLTLTRPYAYAYQVRVILWAKAPHMRP